MKHFEMLSPLGNNEITPNLLVQETHDPRDGRKIRIMYAPVSEI